MGSASLAIDLGLTGPNYCSYPAVNLKYHGEAYLMAASGLEAINLTINQFNSEHSVEFDTVANKKQYHEVKHKWKDKQIYNSRGHDCYD